MKHPYLEPALILFLSILLSGCGPGGDTTDAPQSPEVSEQAEATSEAPDHESDDVVTSSDVTARPDPAEKAATDEEPLRDAFPPGHALRLPGRRGVPADSLTNDSWLGLLVAAIEEGHGRDAWTERERALFRARLHLSRGEDIPIELVLRADVLGERVRLDLPNGSMILRDGESVWEAPGPMGATPPAEARQWIETLPRLLLMPLILRRPGHLLFADHLERVGDEQYAAMTLTFTRDAEAAARHWYAIFADPFHHQVRLIAFYHTSDPTVDPAWQPQDAVMFEAYEVVDDVTLPTRWRWHRWSRSRGLLGESISSVRVTSMGFEPLAAPIFEPPPHATPVGTADDHADAG